MSLHLPPSWDQMSFCNKAGYLAASSQAKNFTDACSMLAKMRRPHNKPKASTVARVARLPYKDSE